MSVSFSRFLFFIRTQTYWIRLTPMTLFWLGHLQRPYFQIRSHSQVRGVRTWTSFWGHSSICNNIFEGYYFVYCTWDVVCFRMFLKLPQSSIFITFGRETNADAGTNASTWTNKACPQSVSAFAGASPRSLCGPQEDLTDPARSSAQQLKLSTVFVTLHLSTHFATHEPGWSHSFIANIMEY